MELGVDQSMISVFSIHTLDFISGWPYGLFRAIFDKRGYFLEIIYLAICCVYGYFVAIFYVLIIGGYLAILWLFLWHFCNFS
jgi:hypothetical protein